MKFSKLSRKLVSVVAAAAMCLSALPFGTIASAQRKEYTLTPIIQGQGSVNISPSAPAKGESVTVTATPEDGWVFDHWEITSPNGSTTYKKTASVVFILDTTGSMSGDIKKVKKNLKELVKSMDSKGIGLNMGIIEYSDEIHYPNSSKFAVFSNGTNWTTDVSEVEAAFDKVHTGSGYEETPTDAFTQLLNSDGSFKFPEDSINNFIFLLTDEPFYDYADNASNNAENHYSMKTWIDMFKNNDIHVSVVTESRYMPKYEDLFTETGGIYIDIDSDDYSDLMKDFSDYLDNTAITVDMTSTENPFTFEMPGCNLCVNAIFTKVEETKLYNITVITEGQGEASASKYTAAAGDVISLSTKAHYAYKLKSIECITGNAVIKNNMFVMPASNVTIKVVFEEDLSAYVGNPYAYIFSYDKSGNNITINCNRKFTTGSSDVEVTVKLGEEYAGKTVTLYTGKKSSSGEKIDEAVLDSRGRATFTVTMGKNYHVIVED